MGSSQLQVLFQAYSKTLDEKNDKYERIYKINRDITNRSKKVIFMLQRIPGLEYDEQKELISAASKELAMLKNKCFSIIAEELTDTDPLKFSNAYTGAIEEYIEALLFYHYISEENVMTLDEVQEQFHYIVESSSTEDKHSKIIVKQKDYILGLADFTGELMRYAVKCISSGNLETCKQVCEVLRQCYNGFLSLPLTQLQSKAVSSKMNVLKLSLEKVESSCYSLELLKLEFSSDIIALCNDLDSVL